MENGKRKKVGFHFSLSVLMKRSWFPISIVAVLLCLLGLLATLQYNWLGKISDDERERMQKRLEIDTARFAEDFNREVQSAYFSFQLDADVWREKNFTSFNERYHAWRDEAKFPALVKDVYFIRDEELLRFDAEQKTFAAAEWTDELRAKQNQFASNQLDTIDGKNFLLTMPIYEGIDRIVVGSETAPLPVNPPEKFGYLVIKLDAETIRNQILPELADKYFSDGANAGFRLSIIDREDASDIVFASPPTNESAGQAADASVPFFNLSPDNLAFFVNRELLSTIRREDGEKRGQANVTFNQTFERRSSVAGNGTIKVAPSSSETSRVNVFKIQRSGNQSPLVLQSAQASGAGEWLLNVRHAEGSLENYITNTRRKNLAVSFGILSLLAISVVLIFTSALRAKRLAQRQMDFVSAVSHEFRTPLAVIYSAGENLTDGVVDSPTHVERYGYLIKREGKKLSAMVEQILEFAGARSGKRKYDFRRADVGEIVKNALAECESLIREKNFSVETEIAENLPPVSADEKALSQAVQNLIINSVKYSDKEAWLKISAKNGAGKIRITVEDKGIGIAPKDLKHIFEPFYRSKTVVDEQIHGNGLGLSLVKQCVEAHGGKIEVESRIGKGSEFTMILTA